MDFQAQLEQDRRDIEQALDRYTTYDPTLHQRTVMEAVRYSLLGGGKRIRAVLTLEVCRALGGDPSRAMPCACALEMIHAYSLIHDDLPCMDDDDLRRGKPSCHKRFGEAMAVLAGDGLQTLAFETLSDEKVLRCMDAVCAVSCIRTLAVAAGAYGMLGGQTIDVENEGHSLTPTQHSNMVRMKTGALLCAAVECGCLAAKASDRQTHLALEYAQYVGQAFQMTDDLLDVTGNTAELGKAVGSDAKSGKITYVTLLGERQAAARADELWDQARRALTRLCPDSTFLMALTDLLATRHS